MIGMKITVKKKHLINEVSKENLNVYKDIEKSIDYQSLHRSDYYVYGSKNLEKILPEQRKLLKIPSDKDERITPEIEIVLQDILETFEKFEIDADKSFSEGKVTWVDPPSPLEIAKSKGRAKPKKKTFSLAKFIDRFKLDPNNQFKSFMNSVEYTKWKDSWNNYDPGFLLLTRHPVDMIKMSDHTEINCHTEGEIFFQCAISEAVGVNGFLVYNISDSDADTLLQMPQSDFQNDEILFDEDRDLDGILTRAMIRVRRISTEDFKHNLFTPSKPYSKHHRDLARASFNFLQNYLIKTQHKEIQWFNNNLDVIVGVVGGTYEDEDVSKLLRHLNIDDPHVDNSHFGTVSLNFSDQYKDEEDIEDQLIVFEDVFSDLIKNNTFSDFIEIVNDSKPLSRLIIKSQQNPFTFEIDQHPLISLLHSSHDFTTFKKYADFFLQNMAMNQINVKNNERVNSYISEISVPFDSSFIQRTNYLFSKGFRDTNSTLLVITDIFDISNKAFEWMSSNIDSKHISMNGEGDYINFLMSQAETINQDHEDILDLLESEVSDSMLEKQGVINHILSKSKSDIGLVRKIISLSLDDSIIKQAMLHLKKISKTKEEYQEIESSIYGNQQANVLKTYSQILSEISEQEAQKYLSKNINPDKFTNVSVYHFYQFIDKYVENPDKILNFLKIDQFQNIRITNESKPYLNKIDNSLMNHIIKGLATPALLPYIDIYKRLTEMKIDTPQFKQALQFEIKTRNISSSMTTDKESFLNDIDEQMGFIYEEAYEPYDEKDLENFKLYASHASKEINTKWFIELLNPKRHPKYLENSIPLFKILLKNKDIQTNLEAVFIQTIQAYEDKHSVVIDNAIWQWTTLFYTALKSLNASTFDNIIHLHVLSRSYKIIYRFFLDLIELFLKTHKSLNIPISSMKVISDLLRLKEENDDIDNLLQKYNFYETYMPSTKQQMFTTQLPQNSEYDRAELNEHKIIKILLKKKK